MAWVLNLLKEKAALQDELYEMTASSIQRKQERAARDAKKPDHICLFMMTPFAPEYKPVEEAVRNILEQKPFWFEVG